MWCSLIWQHGAVGGCCGSVVLPLFVLGQLLMLVVRLIGGGDFPGWGYFFSSLSSAVLWAPLSLLLLLPQYRPVDRDDNRPI